MNNENSFPLAALPGLGPKSAQWLAQVGIITEQQLRKLGPVRAFLLLERGCSVKPSLNFLYAMVGALEERHWQDVALHDKARLLMELESYREMDQFFE
ncbi:TfoX/Sxy family DNA transformation protein [Amphritea balenae]|uniref:TfoX/Sxy family DNA transformation protein n=1 Tax=Amphritea balenae TaxID=452629 RepID=UPI001E360CDF|nr:TfoX/Sxy family DNA transformation protein [Amphritea balenae]